MVGKSCSWACENVCAFLPCCLQKFCSLFNRAQWTCSIHRVVLANLDGGLAAFGRGRAAPSCGGAACGAGEALGGIVDLGAEGALRQLLLQLAALQLSIPAPAHCPVLPQGHKKKKRTQKRKKKMKEKMNNRGRQQ